MSAIIHPCCHEVARHRPSWALFFRVSRRALSTAVRRSLGRANLIDVAGEQLGCW
jgi:hypothetical protein